MVSLKGGVQMPDIWKAGLSLFTGQIWPGNSSNNPSTLKPAKEGERMDSTRKWFNLGSGLMALFIVGLLLPAYKRRLRAIVESAPTWVSEEILSASEHIEGDKTLVNYPSRQYGSVALHRAARYIAAAARPIACE